MLEGDLLNEETCGAERTKQEEVLVMGIEAPGCPQEDTGTREFNEALVDLGCSATVAGKEWVREFEAKSGGTVEWFSTARRAFTGFTGEQASSDQATTLHVRVLGGYGKLLVHVLDTATPLLLSRLSMARLGLVIDVSERSVQSKLSNRMLVCRREGHFKIPLEGTEAQAPLQTKD